MRKITMISRWVLLFCTLMLAVACSPMRQTQSPSTGVQLAQASTPTAQPELSPLQRTTYTVMRGDVRESFTFRGRWLPRDQAQMAFETTGNVRSVNVQRGDTVNAGDVLADLQIGDLENQLQSQLIQLESAQRRLRDSGGSTEDQVRDAQFQLANAQLALDGQRATLPWTQVADARTQVDAANRRLELAERAYNDAISRPDTPASQVDSAYNELQSARENLAIRQRGYNQAAAAYYNANQSVLQQENTVLQRELDLQRAQQGDGTDPDLLDAGREAQLTVDRTREQITQSTLIAPFDGVVLEITIQPGDSVEAFNGVITLALPEPNEMIAMLEWFR